MNHAPMGNPTDFCNLAKALLVGKTNSDALAMAEHARFDKATRILRAVVNGGTLADIGDYTQAVSAFVESLRSDFVFDTLLANGMRRVPMATRAIVTVIGATGTATSELGFKPVSSLDLSAADLTPFKAAVIVILSAELARVLAAAGGDSLLTNVLRGAIGGATDRKFVTEIAIDTVEVASNGGGSAVAIYEDLAALQAAVRVGAQSRLFYVMSSTLAGQIALKPDANGAPAFPMMGPGGGEIANTPVLVSDALESESEGAVILLIDASGIAGDAGTITLSRATNATLQLDSAPVGDASAVAQSLWQSNQVGLKAERYFSFRRLRDDSVAELRGLEVGAS
jgi:HK97 family phage major capsid protein